MDSSDYYDLENKTTIKGSIDIDHAYGGEYRRLELAADELNMKQKEFNDYVNSDPEYLRLENMVMQMKWKV